MKKLGIITVLITTLCFPVSLWQGEHTGLFDDHTAKNIGDSITVVVLETVTSKHKSGNKIDNSNSVSIGPGTGYTSFLSQTSFPNKSKFNAEGEQSSEGELKAEVTVRVKEVLPNGELRVEGDKITNINGEKQIIQITGIVKPENIMEGNKVYSSYIADARITYLQEGEIQNAVEPGWLTKMFNMVF